MVIKSITSGILERLYALCVPNRGKIPANVDRVKLFAARALAE
jgi:hypothetical protein